ncbi:hypothetical protein ACQP3L_38055, partial [Escherichia coli]
SPTDQSNGYASIQFGEPMSFIFLIGVTNSSMMQLNFLYLFVYVTVVNYGINYSLSLYLVTL